MDFIKTQFFLIFILSGVKLRFLILISSLSNHILFINTYYGESVIPKLSKEAFFKLNLSIFSSP